MEQQIAADDSTEMEETMRVHIVNNRMGTHYNRPRSTLKITASKFIVKHDGEKEFFERDEHSLLTPEL